MRPPARHGASPLPGSADDRPPDAAGGDASRAASGDAVVFTLPNAWAMAETLRLDLNSLGPFGIKP